MNLLQKHLTKQMVLLFLSITLLLLLVVWLSQSLRFVQYIVNRGIPVSIFLKLTLFMMPRFLSLILPISTFLVSLFLYNKFNQDRELVIMQAIGMSIWQRGKPVLAFGVFTSFLILALNLWGAPHSSRAFRDLELEIRYNLSKAVLKVGVFNVINNSLVVYVKKVDNNGNMKDLFIADTKDLNKPTYYTAKNGILVSEDNALKLIAQDGTADFIDKTTNTVRYAVFKELVFDTSTFLGSKKVSGWSHAMRELSTKEVIQGVLHDKTEKRGKYIAEINQRIITSSLPLLFGLVIVYFMISTGFNRRGKLTEALISSSFMVLFLMGSLFFINKSQSGRYNMVIAMDIFYFISFTVFIFAINISNRYKKIKEK